MNLGNMSSDRPEAGTPPELYSTAGRLASPSTALRAPSPAVGEEDSAPLVALCPVRLPLAVFRAPCLCRAIPFRVFRVFRSPVLTLFKMDRPVFKLEFAKAKNALNSFAIRLM